ncbi:MAG: hypothetical protein J5I62_09530 [Flavobacteriales bacterium]|nr:hypothetical protein [Flavobacteriales bacterium]
MMDPRYQRPLARIPLVTALLLGLLATWGCRKDKPEEPLQATAGPVGEHGVYITNEGNFQWGNASVSFYDKVTQTATEDLYGPANGGPIGDVCQSMVLHGGKGYVVVNNSGKVVVVDPGTFVEQAVITGFQSPRYFLPVGDDKAYVSDYYAGKVAVVDLIGNAITGHIPCPGTTQEMVLHGGKAYVVNETRGEVHVIDVGTDAVTDTIVVNKGANSIVQDAHGKLWVACSGGGGTAPAIKRIDTQAAAVEASFSYANSANNPWRLRINGTGDTLYFLKGGVFRMAINDPAAPTSAFIPADGRNLYGLGVDPSDGNIYLADALDYTQRGVIYRYGPDGSLQGTFHAGINPSGFCFK